MKTFVTFIALILGVSIACSASRSAGSPPLPGANVATNQVSPPNDGAPAQDRPKCDLTLASVPAVNGLKLRMTTAEVLALFPGNKEDSELQADLARPPSQFGASSFLIKPAKFESREKFADITAITFMLLDGRISNLRLGYNGPEYSHVDKFVAKFVEGTGLPAANQWEAYVGFDTQLKTLKCADFEISVFAGGPGGNLNYVDFKDLEAAKELKARRDKAKAKPTTS